MLVYEAEYKSEHTFDWPILNPDKDQSLQENIIQNIKSQDILAESCCNSRKWDKSNHTNLLPTTRPWMTRAALHSNSHSYNHLNQLFLFSVVTKMRERLVHKHWYYIIFCCAFLQSPRWTGNSWEKRLLLQSHSQCSHSHSKLWALPNCLMRPSHSVNAVSQTWVDIPWLKTNACFLFQSSLRNHYLLCSKVYHYFTQREIHELKKSDIAKSGNKETKR